MSRQTTDAETRERRDTVYETSARARREDEQRRAARKPIADLKTRQLDERQAQQAKHREESQKLHRRHERERTQVLSSDRPKPRDFDARQERERAELESKHARERARMAERHRTERDKVRPSR